MMEGISQHYARLLVNFRVLVQNPSACYAVDYLQLLTLILLGVVLVRWLLQETAVMRLRCRCPVYSGSGAAELLETYRRSACEIGLRKPPPLHRFPNRRPLAFTAGVWEPAIFLSPRLIEALSAAELRALLLHELSHVRRKDALQYWMLEIWAALLPALIIQFFGVYFILSDRFSLLAVALAAGTVALIRLLLCHPLRAFREQRCDDLTVQVTGQPLVLASALIRAWRLGRSLPAPQWRFAPAGAHPPLFFESQLERRVKRLLHYPPRSSRLWRHQVFSHRVAGAGLILLLGWGLLQLESIHRGPPPTGIRCVDQNEVFSSPARQGPRKGRM